LIDNDLDFDEAYYQKIVENFNMLLGKECIEIVKATPTVTITVYEGKCIMTSHPDTLLSETTYTNSCIQKKTFI